MEEPDYDFIGPKGESSGNTLNFVDFIIKPHLNSLRSSKQQGEEYIKEIAAKIDKPVYALDDQSALKIVDNNIEVVSEGRWLLLNS